MPGSSPPDCDPRVAQLTVGGQVLKSVAWDHADLAGYDLVLLLTARAEFTSRRLVNEARLVLDTRNATGALGVPPRDQDLMGGSDGGPRT